jgi:Uma2 family endonuclease
MSTVTPVPATLNDLRKVKDKAELIAGRIVPLMPTGRIPGRIEKRILLNLHQYEEQTKSGEALGDNVGYALRPPLASGRESFAPDVSFYRGSSPHHDAGFIDDSPTFAVEVRSESDVGPGKDQEYAEKREDYFAAGTLVVWDVDYRSETIASYRISDPTSPTVFLRGQTADAEPAMPGWRIRVDEIFA